MNPINDGGPAFPFGQVSESTGQPINGFFAPGMSLRDWLAGQALAALMTNYNSHNLSIKVCVDLACDAADAMIARRERK